MHSLKKRIISLASAIALVMTLLPVSLFASAAETVDVLNGSRYQNSGWGERAYYFSVSDSGTYELEVGYAGGGNSWFKIGVNGTYLGGDLAEGKWTTDWNNSATKKVNVELNSGSNTLSLGVQDGKFTKAVFTRIGDPVETNTITLNASDYSEYTYSDNGTNIAIPFMVNDTSNDISVKVNYSGKGWVNAFTPDGASISGLSGPQDKTDAFSETTKKYYSEQEGPYTFTIKSGSATGKYYVGVTNQAVESIEITYAEGAVSSINGSSGDSSDVGKYKVVQPYNAGCKVSKSGTALTASVTNTRDYKFVGWYSDEECTNLVSSDKTYTLGSDIVYAKFDYVSYNMPVISVVTSENNGSYKEAFPDSAAKSTSYSGSAITLANTDFELPKVEETDSTGTVTGSHDMTVTIKGRGNSTWNLEKRPFQLKFESKVNLFNNGQAKNKKWVLLANHIDRTLLRNNIALDWARTSLTNIPFTSSTQPAELYINGEYQGVYLVVEQSEAAKGRVQATEPTTPTTNLDEFGFLAEWDDLADANEDYIFTDEVINQKFTVKNGFVDDDTLQEQNYNTCIAAVKSYIESVSNAIKNGNESEIESLIDINSAVDMFILQEFTKNADVGGSSFYMSKEAGQKMVFNPPWDFDKGFGNDSRGKDPRGLYVNSGDSNVNVWFQWLYNNDWFKEKVSARWNELRANSATDPKTSALNTINTFTANNTQSLDRQFNKWSTILTKTYPWYGGGYEQYYGDVGTALGSTYSDQLSYLKNWITNRVSYLDTAFNLTETPAGTIKIYAADYSNYTYDDGGAQIAVPIIVNSTANDITVKMNYSDTGWVNVFTPSSANLSGFEGSKTTSDFGDATKTYYVNTSGPFTFTIPAGSPTGVYYAGVTNQSIESLEVSYVSEGDIEKVDVTPTYTVNAYNADGSQISTATYKTGELVEVKTDAEKDGKVFSHWSDSQDGTKVISTKATYQFYTAESIDLYAIYSEPEEKKTNELNLRCSGSYAITQNGANLVRFEFTREISNNYSIVSYGVLYGNSTSVFNGSNEAEMLKFTDADYSQVPNSKVHFSRYTSSYRNGTVYQGIKVGNSKDVIIYARGYVVVKNNKTDEISVVYSDCVKGSFNSLK